MMFSESGQRRDQVKGLKYVADCPVTERCELVFAQAGDISAAQNDLTAIRLVEPGQKTQESRFAAAAFPFNNKELALFHRKADVVKHLDIAVIDRYDLVISTASSTCSTM